MTPHRFSAVGFALLALATVAQAGPIEFGFRTDNIVISGADKPGLDLILRPSQPTGPFSYTPGSNTPTQLPTVTYDPTPLPPPSASDLHWASGVGYTHVNIEGQFEVDVHLQDAASGEEGTVHLFGRAHTYSQYTTTGGWVGSNQNNGSVGDTWFWFGGEGQLKLGDNLYTVRAVNAPSAGGPATVDVWVNDVPPAETPEPGTMLLAGIGLAGVAGASRLRRRTRPVA